MNTQDEITAPSPRRGRKRDVVALVSVVAGVIGALAAVVGLWPAFASGPEPTPTSTSVGFTFVDP